MEVKIFGCRFNKYYAQKWLNTLWNKENSILVASCAVTDNAKRKFIKEVKQQIKKWKKVYLTGCWAFSKNGEIDYAWFYTAYPSLLEYKENIILLPENPENRIIGLEQDHRIKTGLKQKVGRSSEEGPEEVRREKKLEFSNNSQTFSNKSLYTKGFVIVQLGCDSFCSFCITVKKRWNHKNKDVNDIINEIKELEKKWIKEVVLTWINLAAWWMPNTNTYPNPHFPKYLQKILDKTTIPRIRISSIWPEFVDDSWFEVLENDRILPYFHLSIQSWSNKILKLMWRHYTKEHIENIITKLKNLKKSVPVNIGADIIVGFPQETEEDFQQTLELCEKYISKLHVFPFSSHQLGDTVPASKLDWQIDLKTKKEREAKLIKVCDKNYKKLIEATKWKNVQVLIEQHNSGWTENYLKFESKRSLNNGEIYNFTF